jgi:hypothetical protein
MDCVEKRGWSLSGEFAPDTPRNFDERPPVEVKLCRGTSSRGLGVTGRTRAGAVRGMGSLTIGGSRPGPCCEGTAVIPESQVSAQRAS